MKTGERLLPQLTPVSPLLHEYDVQVAIHTDTLNEAGFVEDTMPLLNIVLFTPTTPKGQEEDTHPTYQSLWTK